MNLSYN